MAVVGVAAPVIFQQFFTNSGAFNVGGSVLFQVGGVNTAVYQDIGLTVPLANPCPLNSRGEISDSSGHSQQLFLTPNVVYTATIFDSGGNQIDQAQYVNGVQSNLTQASIGALLFPQTAYEIAAAVTPVNYAYPELDMRRYGADLTGIIPADTAIANGMRVACPLVGTAINARYLYFPAGQYLLNNTINATNTRGSGTLQTDSLRIYGDSAGGTYWIGKTGAGHAMIETTGAQWFAMENITLQDPGTLGRSTIGIFQGVSTALNQTQNQKYTKINIQMNDNMGANGGAGSVGIWNFGSEENTYDTCYVTANLPLMWTAHNPDPSTGFTTPISYQTLASAHSLGVSTFTGECFVVTQAKRGPSIITVDCNSVKFENVYMSNSGTGGTNQSAWKVYGALTGLDFNGTIESHARFLEVTGIAQGVKGRVTFGSIDSPTTEHFLLNRGGQGQLDQCDINILDNVSNARPLFAATPSAPSEQISCFIRNSYFRVNCDKQYLAVQENVLWNPSTGDVTLEGFHNSSQAYRYTIDANRTQEVQIPDILLLTGGGPGGSEVVRFILPTIVATANALAAEVWVEGLAHIGNATTGGMSAKFMQGSMTIALSNTGGIITATDAVFTGTTANQVSAQNNITGLAFSTDATNLTYIKIILTAVRSGSSSENVNFTGTARMRWWGNESRAPSIQSLT
jgi:hypothetical protein